MRAVLLVALVGCGRLAFSEEEPCPQGYAFVAGNAALATGDFCVMQFEAKARDAAGAIVEAGCNAACEPDGLTGVTADSVPAGQPWRYLSAIFARDACRALGREHDLISNPEWMTIARDAERVGANWSGGAPGAGRIVEGRTDGSPEDLSGVADARDPYSDTGNSAADAPGSGWEQRRTVHLSTGGVVWDLAGNVQEWIDWRPGGTLDPAPACAGGELPAVSCAGYTDDDFNTLAGTYDTTTGVGLVIGGSGDAVRRSGQNGDRPPGYAGIYALNMNRFVGDSFPATGFRCVMRLP
jgi:hypothetical protein